MGFRSQVISMMSKWNIPVQGERLKDDKLKIANQGRPKNKELRRSDETVWKVPVTKFYH